MWVQSVLKQEVRKRLTICSEMRKLDEQSSIVLWALQDLIQQPAPDSMFTRCQTERACGAVHAR